MSIVAQGPKVGGGEDHAMVVVPYPLLQATATLTINRDQPDVSNHHEWAVCSGELVLVSDVDPEVRVSKQLAQEWNIESYVVDYARSSARAGDLDDVFAQFVGANERQFEIQNELRGHGFRMAHSMAVLDGDAHPVMVIATGEMAEDDELTPEVIALASEWSLLESPELAEEHGLSCGGGNVGGQPVTNKQRSASMAKEFDNSLPVRPAEKRLSEALQDIVAGVKAGVSLEVAVKWAEEALVVPKDNRSDADKLVACQANCDVAKWYLLQEQIRQNPGQKEHVEALSAHMATMAVSANSNPTAYVGQLMLTDDEVADRLELWFNEQAREVRPQSAHGVPSSVEGAKLPMRSVDLRQCAEACDEVAGVLERLVEGHPQVFDDIQVRYPLADELGGFAVMLRDQALVADKELTGVDMQHKAPAEQLEQPDGANAEAREILGMLRRGPDTPGFLLAFPEGTKAEAEEIVNMLRHGGNTVVVVEPSLAGPVLDAVDWHMAMAQDDLDPFAQG